MPEGQTVTVPLSFLFNWLHDHVDKLKAKHQKIGVVPTDHAHEVALIDVDEASPRRYVLVALGAVYSKGHNKSPARRGRERDRPAPEAWHLT
jgi:hypothetical protein